MRTDLTIQEAVEVLTQLLPVPQCEFVPLMQAFNRVLSDDLASLVDHPSTDDSALDGYAVRLEDTLNATPENPIRLHCVGTIAAGATSFTRTLEANQAVKVFTGATVPDGTTGIVAVENTVPDGEFINVLHPATPDIRRKSQDLKQGNTYLKRGQRLRGASIALAASMGHAQIPVFEKPRIAILSTGDEITEPGQPLPAGGTYNSSYGLAALIQELGGEAIMLPRVMDDINATRNSLNTKTNAHLILSIGGISMGERDFVRTLLETEGHIEFWRLKLKPGGPPLCGTWNNTAFFGLPGNPVSSMVVFIMVIKAALYARWQNTEPAYETVTATTLTAFKSYGAKMGLQRATLTRNGTGFTVSAFSNQSSQVLRSMIESNALVVIPPYISVSIGDLVEVIRL